MTKVIAEIGWNHMGDMDLAEHMIASAASSGASYAKFQTWSCARLKSGPWDLDGRTAIYKKAELSIKDHIRLRDFCSSVGISFMSSVFSVPDAILLAELGVAYVKIPSSEASNQSLLEFCDKNFDFCIVSTGTCTSKEIINIISTFKQSELTLLHCVSSYPCDFTRANLPRLLHLSKYCPNVGFSDHCHGIYASIAALQYHPTYIEKHFTTDNNLPGRDNQFAILPGTLSQLVLYIEQYAQCLIDHGIDYQDVENDTRLNYRGRFNNV